MKVEQMREQAPMYIDSPVTYTGERVPSDCKKGVVAMIDFDIGITIVHREDKNKILYCLHGPLSYVGKNFLEYPMKYYLRTFENMLVSIQSGIIDFKRDSYTFNGPPTKKSCPFSR